MLNQTLKRLTKNFAINVLNKNNLSKSNEAETRNKQELINPLSANPTKWSNTLKQFVGNLLTNCLSVFDHCVKLALKQLRPCRYGVQTEN